MKVLIPNFNIIPNDRLSLQLCTQSPGEVLVKQTLAGCKGFPAYGRWYIQAFGIKILSWPCFIYLSYYTVKKWAKPVQ